MIFRPAMPEDVPAIMTLVEAAVRRLGAMGVDQWQHGYPNRARIEQDLAEGFGYVMEEDGRVVAYGAVILTGEEAYRAIEGRWLTEEENYVVVHRLCVAEEVVDHGFGRRFMEAVEQLSRGRVRSFRVDTHADNRVMQSLLPRIGFQCCGTIRIDGRPFEAFEKIIE